MGGERVGICSLLFDRFERHRRRLCRPNRHYDRSGRSCHHHLYELIRFADSKPSPFRIVLDGHIGLTRSSRDGARDHHASARFEVAGAGRVVSTAATYRGVRAFVALTTVAQEGKIASSHIFPGPTLSDVAESFHEHVLQAAM